MYDIEKSEVLFRSCKENATTFVKFKYISKKTIDLTINCYHIIDYPQTIGTIGITIG